MAQETLAPESAQSHEFRAEIRQLLDIVINSLYTHREIFLRELISNAADALEKFRHQALLTPEIPDKDRALEIRLSADTDAHTLVIADSGIGMTRDELVENLGTIAHSGTRAFLEKMGEGAPKDVSLIGQFGVGFYSAFMVAKKVTVETRSYQDDAHGWRWESDGTGAYTISAAPEAARGTRITLELRDDQHEYAEPARVRDIVHRFSSFVAFPILLGDERLNTVQAIWTRSKSELSDQDYLDFYRFIAGGEDEPHYRLHFTADAPLAINALLYVPKDNLERLGFGRTRPSVDLYCRKVLIMKHPEDLLPEWMRFARGVIDSEDLPLNISRETLQDNRLIRKIATTITNRFLKFLEEESHRDADKYAEFYRTHAHFLKEGATMSFEHREALAKLLRFESSTGDAGKLVSLAEYVARMKDGQKAIYYINGASRAAIEAGPYVEALKARGFEVLYLFESIDDFVMNHLMEFDGRKLVSADRDDLELEGDAPDATGEPLSAERLDGLCGWLKMTLGESVAAVRASTRLVDSPAVATSSTGLTGTMQRLLQSMHRGEDAAPPIAMNLEINPRHPVIHRLDALRESDAEFAGELARQLADTALLAAGLLADPRSMVARLNKLLARAAGVGS